MSFDQAIRVGELTVFVSMNNNHGQRRVPRMPGDSMKSTAFTLTATSLFQILAPGVSVFAEELSGGKPDQIGDTKTTMLSVRKPLSDRDRALAVAERAIGLFYQGNVVVMSRSTLDPSKLEDGWYAYVVYNYETDQRAELAEIAEIGERHLAINSSYGSWGFSGTLREIPFGDIHIIVGAENRGDIT